MMLPESAGAGLDSAEADAPAPLVAASVAVMSSAGRASPESGTWGDDGIAATAGSLRGWNQEQPETVTSTKRPVDRRAAGIRFDTFTPHALRATFLRVAASQPARRSGAKRAGKTKVVRHTRNLRQHPTLLY